MMLRRFVALAVFVAVLVMAPRMWASGVEAARVEKATSSASLASARTARPALQARPMTRKAAASELKFEEHYDAELIVKFRDSVHARKVAGSATKVVSRSGRKLDAFQAIVDQYSLRTAQYINKSEQELTLLQSQAESRSSRAQPDLAGILRVTGSPAVIERAAREINALDFVEFVEFASVVDVLSRDEIATARQQLAEVDGPLAAHRSVPQQRKDRQAVDVWDGNVIPTDLDRTPTSPSLLHSRDVPLDLDTGFVASTDRRAAGPQIVFSDLIEVPDVPWIRLFFRDVQLGGTAAADNASYVVVTSLHTGESQTLDTHDLQQWSYATAYFQGGSLLVQVFAYAGTGVNRLVLDRAEVGEWAGGFALSICDTDDDRVQSADPAVGRLMGGGQVCSAFLFNDRESCLLTASHCQTALTAGGATVHFNVPNSLPDGTPVPSAVVDQFPVLVDSMQFEPLPLCPTEGGCDADWALFGVGDNSAGQTPLQWQGTSHTLASALPPVDGRQVIVRGYGETVATNAPNTWSNTLTEASGPLIGSFGTSLQYRVDVTDGTAGGPVIDATTNLVIGIHTCGNCLPGGTGTNSGTGVNHPNIVHALANPDACSAGVQGYTGSCCIGGNCFNNYSVADCAASGGTFNGVGTICPSGPLFDGFACNSTYLCCSPSGCSESTWWECEALCGSSLNFYGVEDYVCDDNDPPDPFIPCDEDPDCGAPAAGDCFEVRNTTHCSNEDLCDQICEIDPFCCDPDVTFANRGSGHWDAICVWHARRLTGQEVHPCFLASGDCGSANDTPGCSDTGCCLAVCSASPACCGDVYDWDPHCVELAQELCGLATPDDPTPDLSAAQGYLTAASYMEEHGSVPAGVGQSLGPWNFNLPLLFPTDFAFDFKFDRLPLLGWGGEGFDLDGLWEFGELIGGENLTAGATIRIGVLYPTAFVDPDDESNTHEDLRGRVTYPEVDQTMLINPLSPSGLLDGHVGTAVLGIIGANPDNNSGMTGMAPDSDLYFFPTVSQEEGGRFQNAFMSALEIFEPGDVLVLPYTTRISSVNFTSTALGWTLINFASDMGITCVVAAGDGAVAITEQASDEADSRAIVVGAVTPGFPYFREPHSNGCVPESDNAPCPALSSVHISGWGAAVATTGFGDLFMGSTGGASDPMRSYTSSFGGTAAAAAQIGAVAARLQGLAKQFWGIPLAPEQIRGELSLTGFCQGDYCMGAGGPPGPGGGDGTPQFFGDWSLEAEPLHVGSIRYPSPQFDLELWERVVFADLPAVAEWIVAEGYFDDCEIEEAYTIRGQGSYGNPWSLCSLDQNYYVVRSQETEPGSGPTMLVPDFAREVDKITYGGTGQIADVLAVVRPDWDVVTSLSISTLGNIADGRGAITFIEVFDWNDRLWDVAGVNVNAGGVVSAQSFAFLGAQEYVRSSDNAMLVRVWVLGLPIPGEFGDGAGELQFDLNLDVIDINVGGYYDHKNG